MTHFSLAKYLIAATLFFACLVKASAIEYNQIDTSKSKISFAPKLMGSQFNGEFKKFSGKVFFNPAKPEQSSAELTVDIASIDMGSDELKDESLGKAWFNTKLFPQAQFIAQHLSPLGNDRYQVTGQLTIKNKSLPVSMPVTLRQQGHQAIFEGSLAIKRLDFLLGEGAWADTSSVANEVPVKIFLVLNPKK